MSDPVGARRVRSRLRTPAVSDSTALDTAEPVPPGARPGRDDDGDTLALLVLWPTLLVAIMVLLVHAFIVANAQAEAEVAASAGLRAAWRSAANEDFLSALDVNGDYTPDPYVGGQPHPKTFEMAADARSAVARAAAATEGWRWWTPGAAEVQSDWCYAGAAFHDIEHLRPTYGEPGWVRVVVSGEVFGPLASLWPGRLDRVHAVATGPAVITSVQLAEEAPRTVPVSLPAC